MSVPVLSRVVDDLSATPWTGRGQRPVTHLEENHTRVTADKSGTLHTSPTDVHTRCTQDEHPADLREHQLSPASPALYYECGLLYTRALYKQRCRMLWTITSTPLLAPPRRIE
jgi:hypothetical protein